MLLLVFIGIVVCETIWDNLIEIYFEIQKPDSIQDSYEIPLEINTFELLNSGVIEDCDSISFFNGLTEEEYTSWMESLCGTKDFPYSTYWIQIDNMKTTHYVILSTYNSENNATKLNFSEGITYYPTSLNGSCPEGFGEVDTFNNFYLRGAFGDFGDNHFFSSGKHSHESHGYLDEIDSSNTSMCNQPGAHYEQKWVSSRTHTHYATIYFSDSDYDLKYLTQKFCSLQGRVDARHHFLAFFDSEDDFEGSNWIHDKKNCGSYLRGGNTVDSGGTLSHSHSIQSFTIEYSGHVSCNENGEYNIADHYHGHTFENVILEEINHEPPHRELLFVRPDPLKIPRVEESMVIISNFIPPMGYELVSSLSNLFIKSACDLDSVGNGGGSEYHKHSVFAVTTTGDAYERGEKENYPYDCANHNHIHTFNQETSEQQNIPSFYSVYFIKKKSKYGISVKNKTGTFDPSLIPDENDNDNGGVTTGTVLGLIFGFLAFFAVVFVLVVLIVLLLLIPLLMYKKKLNKFKELDADLILQEWEVNNSASKEGMASLKINKKLFEVNIDEIQITKKIAQGGGGSVIFLAKFHDVEVVFKAFRGSDVMTSQTEFNEFEKEVSILGSVKHKNILSFMGACLKPPRVGILMEYCELGDLRHYFLTVMKKKCPKMMRIRIIKGICAGMAYLHSKNIIHRDLKPENVLIGDDKEAKIMDFGLSKMIDKKKMGEMTKKIGSNFYMAPEIIKGKENYDSKVDVFSFGILLGVVITQNFEPYGSNSRNADLFASQNPNFRPKYDKNDFIGSMWMLDLIEQCLQDNPDHRPTFDYIIKKLGENERHTRAKSATNVLPVNRNNRPPSGKFIRDRLEIKRLKATIEEQKQEIERLNSLLQNK